MQRRAAALFPILGLIALVAAPVAWRFMAVNPSPAASTSAASTLFPPQGEGQGNSDLEVALLRAGVSPKSLAAVGAPTNSIVGIIEAARAQFVEGSVTLAAADAAYATAKRESDRLRRKIESGKGSQEDVTNFQTQSTALATASAQQAAALAALSSAATISLTQAQRDLLLRIQQQSTWGLPIEFLVAERTEPAWVELRSALANERFAAKYGEEPESAAVTLLSVARADAGVAAARAGLDTNLTYVTASWTSALED